MWLFPLNIFLFAVFDPKNLLFLYGMQLNFSDAFIGGARTDSHSRIQELLKLVVVANPSLPRCKIIYMQGVDWLVGKVSCWLYRRLGIESRLHLGWGMGYPPVPKVDTVEEPKDFRPIGLCNVLDQNFIQQIQALIAETHQLLPECFHTGGGLLLTIVL
uniref:Uncharacterized protein n=1 Tax=Nelumbo nucifera TaxID=4432 RepID=A0A822ZQW7_NELNU|nr:TPA_asm: hypothetical protein HUJ06_016837 [Nelumbo nucifera]